MVEHNLCCLLRNLHSRYKGPSGLTRGLTPGHRWRVAGVRTGVRALPPRDQHGSLPLAGRVDSERDVWVVGGLGARGLVYHAWLGSLVASAVLSSDESLIPVQLRRWQK